MTENELREIEDRFRRSVLRIGSCWMWCGARTAQGYGRFGAFGEVYAHRVAWILANRRPIPDGFVVMHSCDNPPCVNPAHLSVGTHGDNARDAAAKGRHVRGERHHSAKLETADIYAIRYLADQGVRRRDIALVWRVHESTVGRVARREDWRWVKEKEFV